MKERPKTCEVCKKGFTPKNYWQKYCNNTCKMAAWAIGRFADLKTLIAFAKKRLDK